MVRRANSLLIGQSIRDSTLGNHRVSENGGKRYCRLLSCCGVIAQRGGACGLSLHIAPPSFLPTLRPPYFPQLAFVIAHPPPLQNLHALSLSHWDISAVTISHGKGNRNFPNTPDTETNVRLEQPIANWAKLRGQFVEVFGGTFAWSLRGHSSLRTDQRATSIYRTIDPQGFRISMLATTRILVFRLATARVFCFPPTTPHSPPAPSLSSRDLPVPTISSDKGSDTSPTPPPVEIWKKLDGWNRLLRWFWFSYISILITFSFVSYWLLSQCICLALENWWNHDRAWRL